MMPTCHTIIHHRRTTYVWFPWERAISEEEAEQIKDAFATFYSESAFVDFAVYASQYNVFVGMSLQTYEWTSIETSFGDSDWYSNGVVPYKELILDMAAKSEIWPCAPLLNDFENVLGMSTENIDTVLNEIFEDVFEDVDSWGGRVDELSFFP